MADDREAETDHLTLTYLEFFSGVGGWSFALEEACRRINKGVSVSAESGGRRGTRRKELRVRRLAAFDHSDLCNSVMRHNFPDHLDVGETAATRLWEDDRESRDPRKRKRSKGSAPAGTKTVSIEKLTRRQLQDYAAAVWAMSPPCQPYTRQHTNQAEDLKDPRNKSFLHLCETLRTMDEEALPSIILLENVVGFEKSSSCCQWRETLSCRQYHVAHFHLSPTQVGIPNDRPRYFCVAVRRAGDFVELFVEDKCSSEASDTPMPDKGGKSIVTNKGDAVGLEGSIPHIHTCVHALGIEEPTSTVGESSEEHLPAISDFLDADLCADVVRRTSSNNSPCCEPCIGAGASLDSLRIPQKILRSSASWCFDIVTPMDRRSACFTHSYGSFVRGTGSVLYMGSTSSSNADKRKAGPERFKLVPPEQRQFDMNWAEGLDLEKNLRYFSGSEIAHLMGFPVSALSAVNGSEEKEGGMRMFGFPSTCTMKQQWKLLGNSLNVRVAARIAEIGLRANESN